MICSSLGSSSTGKEMTGTISKMLKSGKKGFKILAIIFTVVIVFTIHLKFLQPSKGFFQVKYSMFSGWGRSEITSMETEEPVDIHQKINQILDVINQTILNNHLVKFNDTTSAKYSRAKIIDYKGKYCVGDPLTVQVEMFNHLGKKKTYGGDFLRARIFSSKLKAGASGKIEDYNNGTYNVYFTLFWEGPVEISILLMHPSEGVSALWRARNTGFKYISYIGKYLNKGQEVQTECGFHLDSQKEKCGYVDKTYDESFYCIKPPGVACEAFISLRSINAPYTNLTEMEKNLFIRSQIGVEMMKHTEQIKVLTCTRTPMKVATKCKIGMSPPFPSGYFLKNQFYPLYCNLSLKDPLSQIQTCLAGKMIYLMGDSTIRQWIEFFPKVLKYLKFYDTHGIGWHKTYKAFDVTNNIYIQWKKHGHPFVTQSFFSVRDNTYVTNEINRIGGGSNTIIVIALGQHFRPFPLTLFIKRLLNVRKAIENLFLRSPDTKVIIKSENTREINTDVERFSDFHGYIQYLLVKEVFRELNIGIIDAWDMTTAFGSYNVHPPEPVIRNQINIFLSYIC